MHDFEAKYPTIESELGKIVHRYINEVKPKPQPLSTDHHASHSKSPAKSHNTSQHIEVVAHNESGAKFEVKFDIEIGGDDIAIRQSAIEAAAQVVEIFSGGEQHVHEGHDNSHHEH